MLEQQAAADDGIDVFQFRDVRQRVAADGDAEAGGRLGEAIADALFGHDEARLRRIVAELLAQRAHENPQVVRVARERDRKSVV